MPDQADSLRRLMGGEALPSLLRFSGVAGGGVSTCLAGLATACAAHGRRVLAVDAAPRPSLARLLAAAGPGPDTLRLLRARAPAVNPWSSGDGTPSPRAGSGPWETESGPPAGPELAGGTELVLAGSLESVLADGFDPTLAGGPELVLVDGGAGGPLDADLILVLNPAAEAVTQGYRLLKAQVQVGMPAFVGVLVNRAEAAPARAVFETFARTAARFLGLRLRYLGAVPDAGARSPAAAAGVQAAFRALAAGLPGWPLAGVARPELADVLQKLVLSCPPRVHTDPLARPPTLGHERT